MSVVNLNGNEICQLNLIRDMKERVLFLIFILIFYSNAWSLPFEDCGSDYFRQGAGQLRILVFNQLFI